METYDEGNAVWEPPEGEVYPPLLMICFWESYDKPPFFPASRGCFCNQLVTLVPRLRQHNSPTIARHLRCSTGWALRPESGPFSSFQLFQKQGQLILAGVRKNVFGRWYAEASKLSTPEPTICPSPVNQCGKNKIDFHQTLIVYRGGGPRCRVTHLPLGNMPSSGGNGLKLWSSP